MVKITLSSNFVSHRYSAGPHRTKITIIHRTSRRIWKNCLRISLSLQYYVLPRLSIAVFVHSIVRHLFLCRVEKSWSPTCTVSLVHVILFAFLEPFLTVYILSFTPAVATLHWHGDALKWTEFRETYWDPET